MEIIKSNKGLTGYQFLMLYSAILFKESKTPFINKLDLEEALYSYSNDENYSSLFGPLIADKENNNGVNLTEAFMQAEQLGLLKKIPSPEDDPTYGILMTPGMEDYIISTYFKNEVKAMKKIVDTLNPNEKKRS